MLPAQKRLNCPCASVVNNNHNLLLGTGCEVERIPFALDVVVTFELSVAIRELVVHRFWHVCSVVLLLNVLLEQSFSVEAPEWAVPASQSQMWERMLH